MAELFGRRSGCAHGRGGSMHLLDAERGFYGGWGIVAGQLPIATGLALGLVRQGRPQAVLCELGDGAVNMGAWHEALNLAALWQLPVVFLVINNEYGMGTSVERASAEPELWRRASAFRMHGERVDGDDLDASSDACERLLARAREERQPALLEAVTYRYRGHSVADAGIAYRTKDEVAAHQAARPDAAHPGAADRSRRGPSRARRARARGRRAGAAPRSSSRRPIPSPTYPSSPRACTRPAASSSSSACDRAARWTRWSWCSTEASADDGHGRARERRGDDLPRGAAARPAGGARARPARLRDGRGGRRLRRRLQGHRRLAGGVRARPRARHAHQRGGLRRRGRGRRDARRAPGGRDHDPQLPAGRHRPGGEPRRQDRRDVRRRRSAARW